MDDHDNGAVLTVANDLAESPDMAELAEQLVATAQGQGVAAFSDVVGRVWGWDELACFVGGFGVWARSKLFLVWTVLSEREIITE